MVQRNLSGGVSVASAQRFLPRRLGTDVAVLANVATIVHPLSHASPRREGRAAPVAYTVAVVCPAPSHSHEEAALGSAQEVPAPVQTAVVLFRAFFAETIVGGTKLFLLW